MSIMVDAEFKALIPPLSPEEYAQLEENCVRDGIRDPLVVWATNHGTQILVDGHNRWKIAAEHGGMHFDVIEKKFDTRADAEAWIIKNQLGRRNIEKWTRYDLVQRLEEIEKAKAKKRQGTRTDIVPTLAPSNPGKTRDKMANMVGVSHGTYDKMKTIEEHGTPEVKAKARSGEISINTAYNLTNGYDKTPAQRQKEFMDSIQKEHEEFKEQKKEAVVSLTDARKDESRQRILALDYYDRCLKVCKAIWALDVDIREGTIDLQLMSSNIEDGQKTELARRLMHCRQILDKIEQEVKG